MVAERSQAARTSSQVSPPVQTQKELRRSRKPAILNIYLSNTLITRKGLLHEARTY